MPHPFYSARTLELFNHFRRPLMSAGIRFALIYASMRDKVLAFDSLNGLCRSIQRARDGAAIQLENNRLLFQGETVERDVISIYALDDAGGRQRFLGHAWIDGGRREALQSALYAGQSEALPLRAFA